MAAVSTQKAATTIGRRAGIIAIVGRPQAHRAHLRLFRQTLAASSLTARKRERLGPLQSELKIPVMAAILTVTAMELGAND